jgi:hypothetical protein
MPGILFNNDKTVAIQSDGGNVFPMQDLAKGFTGVDPNTGAPVTINPGKLNFDPTQVRANAHGGTIRFQQGGTTGAVDEATHWRAQDMQPVDAGVAGSARGTLGMPRPANELRPGDLVTLPGPDNYQVTASVAARLGYLRQLPSGGYENTNAGEPQAAAPTPAAQAPAAVSDPMTADIPVDEEYVGHVAVVQRGLPEVFVANAISEVVANGAFSPEAVNAAAKHLDTTPDAVLGALNGALKTRTGHRRDTNFPASH